MLFGYLFFYKNLFNVCGLREGLFSYLNDNRNEGANYAAIN